MLPIEAKEAIIARLRPGETLSQDDEFFVGRTILDVSAAALNSARSELEQQIAKSHDEMLRKDVEIIEKRSEIELGALTSLADELRSLSQFHKEQGAITDISEALVIDRIVNIIEKKVQK